MGQDVVTLSHSILFSIDGDLKLKENKETHILAPKKRRRKNWDQRVEGILVPSERGAVNIRGCFEIQNTS